MDNFIFIVILVLTDYNIFQQSHEQQLYQQGRQPIYHQQNVNYQKGYDGGSQYTHGNEQQPLYNQQSYQMGYNQQQAVPTQYYTVWDFLPFLFYLSCFST